MCGEEAITCGGRGTKRGSPPHVRGRGSSEAKCPVSHGITPACAGKSKAYGRHSAWPGDHPRMCGEETLWLNRKS